MRLHPFPVLLLALAACGTPQEQCISRNTRDLRTVESLIAQSEKNLARGYALEDRTEWQPDWVPCGPPPPPRIGPDGKPRPSGPPRMCWDERPVTVTRPVSIDLNAETRKLASLKQKRAELSRQAQSVVRQCKALYPE